MNLRPGFLALALTAAWSLASPLMGGENLFLEALQEASAAEEGSATAVNEAWWSNAAAGLIGGFGGAAFGLLAALFSWLAGRGKARSTVVVGVTVMIAVSAVCLVIGLVALALRQPYAVVYPMLLLGGLGVLIMPTRLRAMRQHYTTLELNQMRRQDLGGMAR